MSRPTKWKGLNPAKQYRHAFNNDSPLVFINEIRRYLGLDPILEGIKGKREAPKVRIFTYLRFIRKDQ